MRTRQPLGSGEIRLIEMQHLVPWPSRRRQDSQKIVARKPQFSVHCFSPSLNYRSTATLFLKIVPLQLDRVERPAAECTRRNRMTLAVCRRISFLLMPHLIASSVV